MAAGNEQIGKKWLERLTIHLANYFLSHDCQGGNGGRKWKSQKNDRMTHAVVLGIEILRVSITKIKKGAFMVWRKEITDLYNLWTAVDTSYGMCYDGQR